MHEFAGGDADGGSPIGGLTLSADGSRLYGMTSEGGDADAGVIFWIPATGGDVTLLHEFAGGTTDGSLPYGSLTVSEDAATLYGMTVEGGQEGAGVIFSIPAAGGNITLLHSFAGDTVEGEWPYGSLTLSADGSMLYGMTHEGGASDGGTLFSSSVTLAELAYFFADTRGGAESVWLKWKTVSELRNVGFHVWRSTAQDGTYERITVDLIPAEGGFAQGAEYFFEDTAVGPDHAYWYKLEDVDCSGASTFHGPIVAQPKAAWAVPETRASTVGNGARTASRSGGALAMFVPAMLVVLLARRRVRPRTDGGTRELGGRVGPS